MLKKYFLILPLLFINFNSYSQQKSVVKKYENQFKLFDSLNNIRDKKAGELLKNIQKTVDFKNNDTLKVMVYSSWGLLYIQNQDLNNVNKYCDYCITLSLKKKMYDRASRCAHNKAVMYQFNDKIDTSIVLEKKALKYAELGKDSLNYYKSIIAIARKLVHKGQYKESNEILIKNLNYIKDAETKGVALLTVASNYREQGAKINLDNYYKQGIYNIKKATYKNVVWSGIHEYCNYLIDKEDYKNTLIYSDSIVYFSKSEVAVATSKYLKARAYYGLKDYNNGLANINMAIVLDTKNYDALSLLDDYNVRGKIFLDQGKTKLAINDFKTAKNLFKEAQDNTLEAEVLKHNILANLKDTDSELYKDFERYVTLKDSLYNEENIASLSEFETKYRTIEKESKIKTQQLQIQKEKTNKNIALSSIGLILLLGLGGFWFYRSKQNQSNLKTQNTLLGLQQNLIEAELSNLNKQLDPHEIKNLLAHISPEIQEKAPESYRKMLKLFNLTKASLNSNSITDTIENQLKQIDDFLSLEKSMSSIPLEYSIQNSIENTQTEIPRLLLKNLVENAIKHGIKQQETGGNISVIVQEKDNFIHIAVDDTGKGRQHAISLDSGIGTTTYQKLFATLNPKNKENATFEIIDKEQGTKVEVKIPTNYKYI